MTLAIVSLTYIATVCLVYAACCYNAVEYPERDRW